MTPLSSPTATLSASADTALNTPPAGPTTAQPAIAQQRTFIAQALDPIHIGTGEFRLGRVDNTIVREPGTNLPKIPGSSIAGVTRAYAAMKAGKYLDANGNSCAGKGGKDGGKHCGTCEVCVAFGFSKSSGSFQGLAQFSDARLLFFPVYSLIGPVWISCPSALASAECTKLGDHTWDQWNLQLGEGSALVAPTDTLTQINLGWMYLPLYTAAAPSTVPSLTDWVSQQTSLFNHLSPVLARLVIVSDAHFSAIVDDQLEVRTSVSISPETGAAEPGALFTAEALPRATIFLFQVTVLNPANFRIPNGTPNGRALTQDIDAIHTTVWKGLELIEFLGVGGVNTRGMGRLKVYREVKSQNA